MKVQFPIISNLSGADVYFERLAQGLPAHGVETDLRMYPHLMEFLPYHALTPFFPTPGDGTLVHTKAEYGWLFAVPGKPLVVTVGHCVFDPVYKRYKGRLKRLYHNLKVKRNIAHSFAVADRIVTVSHSSAMCLTKCFGQHDVRVIYNGVDEDFFRPPSPELPAADGPTRVFFAANCTVRKGYDLLAPILSRLGEGFVLELATGLRTRVRNLPHPAMRSLGGLKGVELLKAYQRCDIFLFPSRLEGFGYPVAEAMACGKPVVCTDCSSLPELIDEGRGGYLCPRDDVDAFADRIRQLARDPDLRAQMGAYNRAKVKQQFSLSHCLAQYAALYAELG